MKLIYQCIIKLNELERYTYVLLVGIEIFCASAFITHDLNSNMPQQTTAK